MGMKYCPDCGEEYSDTYKRCPFCEEEEMLRNEKAKRRIGRRSKPTVSPITVILLILIAAMSAVLVYLLKDMKPVTPPPDAPAQEQPAETPDRSETPAEPDAPAEVPSNTAPENGDDKDPKLNKEDMTLSGNESAQLELSGVTTKVSWTSSNESVAKVSDNGLVTAVRNGMCEIQASWDGQARTCIVRVVNAGSADPGASPEPTTPPTQSEQSSGLKTGAAKVCNAAGGVYVRSGPGTGNEALATLKTGNDVTILENAGSGWYKISFVGMGGRTATGYMKGDYLTN